MENLNLKKIFLYTLIGSITVSAILGILAILANEFNELQGRILATTLTVVATSILGLACGAFWESPKSRSSPLRIVPGAGIILALVSGLIGLLMIWEISASTGSFILKAFSICAIFAFTLAQLSLLSLASLAKKFQWALTAVYIIALGLASIETFLIVTERTDEDGLLIRLIGVLAVVDASLTVLIPIFHRLSYGDLARERPEIEQLDAEIAELKDKLAQLEARREELAGN